MTSVHYMKKIINGTKFHLKISEVIPVDVPLFDELMPLKVIEAMKLEKNEKEIYNKLV